ncbi:unnamed protein product, partial [Staurois parvus]
MQTASTDICERMGRSQELNAFKRGTVIGCHLCNKSIREISLLLNIPRSTVSGIITKWKQLGKAATQPQSGRPHNLTEQSQCMLKCIVCRSRQLSAKTIAKELHGSGFHGRAAVSKTYITKCNAKHWMQWCTECHYWTLEQWRCVLWSDESHFSKGYLPHCIVPSVKF